MRFLFKRFFSALGRLIVGKNYNKILDAGFGEGETIFRLRKILPDKVEGFDCNSDCINDISKRFLEFHFTIHNIYELPYADGDFDLILCCEVTGASRVSPQGPFRAEESSQTSDSKCTHEPWFQIGNFFRGKYLSTWGNNPEFIQHWNPELLHSLLSAFFPSIEIYSAFPMVNSALSYVETTQACM